MTCAQANGWIFVQSVSTSLITKPNTQRNNTCNVLESWNLQAHDDNNMWRNSSILFKIKELFYTNHSFEIISIWGSSTNYKHIIALSKKIYKHIIKLVKIWKRS